MPNESTSNHVKACVGCGYCCIKTPCDVSRRLYGGGITECPQLTWEEDDNRYSCGLMRIYGDVGRGYRKELYAGEGCCASLNSWRNDVQRRTGVSHQHAPLPKLLQRFIGCLARQFVSGDVITLTTLSFIESLKKDGYSEEEITFIQNNISRIFKDNRSSISEEFLG